MYWPLLLGGIRFCLRSCHLIAGSVPRVRWARRSVPFESISVVRCTPDTAIRHFHLPEYFRAKGEISIFFFEGDIKALSLSFFEFHTGVRTVFFVENSNVGASYFVGLPTLAIRLSIISEVEVAHGVENEFRTLTNFLPEEVMLSMDVLLISDFSYCTDGRILTRPNFLVL